MIMMGSASTRIPQNMVQVQMILPYHVYLREESRGEESMQPIATCQRQGKGGEVGRLACAHASTRAVARLPARCTLPTARGHYTYYVHQYGQPPKA